MKRIVLCSVALGALVASALPQVSNVKVSYSTPSRVEISYDLIGGPAIVTLDVLTNAAQWTSIGVDALYGTNAVPGISGDVFRRVSGDTRHTIVWNAFDAWGMAGGRFAPGELKFEVKAFPYANSPDYLVTDLRPGIAAADRVKYYPSEDFLPGGLLANPAYRTTHLVLRRIRARNVRWTMGATVGIQPVGSLTEFRAHFEPKETVAGV